MDSLNDFEAVNPHTLPSVAFEEIRQLPDLPGLYFVLSDTKELLYVGRAGSLKKRWRQHHRAVQLAELEGVTVAWLRVDDPKLLDDAERLLIKCLTPKLNGLGYPKPVASKNGYGGAREGTGPKPVFESRVRITFDEEQAIRDRLDDVAKAQGFSRADVVRQAVKEYLNKASNW